MGLKQNIVIVNEFTRKLPTGGGSRGGTPGEYVTRYMSRPRATETLAPATYYDGDTFVMRYMARQSATEKAHDRHDVKPNIRKADGQGGVAFGYGDVSLSHEKLQYASDDIQAQFDSGKTVMKTVLSFDTDYLKQHGILPSDFKVRNRGDLRGNVDQLKLRRAVMNGLRHMGRYYDNLQYIGVIQVDTEHVHCHLAMVDRGEGKEAVDGYQRGKINETAKRALRHGIELSLDRDKTLQYMNSNVSVDKQNVKSYVKSFTSQLVKNRGNLQFLLACLPQDDSLWRAGTNRRNMQKANTVARMLVTEMLRADKSGYASLMRRLYEYADTRMEKEDLSLKERDELVSKGRNQVLDECVNAVYGVLKKIPEEKRIVTTPMLEAMSVPLDEIQTSTEDPLLDFSFRLRSYSARLHHHKELARKMDADYQALHKVTASEAGQSVLDYLAIERLYQELCLGKYQKLVPFIELDKDVEEEMNELIRERKYIEGLEQMMNDKALYQVKPHLAEKLGLEVYGVDGGRYLQKDSPRIQSRIRKRSEAYGERLERFQRRLEYEGYTFDGQGIKRRPIHSFEESKMADLHRLEDDWNKDTPIASKYVERFKELAYERYDAFQMAKQYLEKTGQAEYLKELPERDVEEMKAFADRFTSDTITKRAGSDAKEIRRVHTVSLDEDYEMELLQEIRETVQEAEENLEIE